MAQGNFLVSERITPNSLESENRDCVRLSENTYLFSNRTIGNHDNVYEGEVRSSVYGVRPCVIKFATISEQNIREAEILTKLGSHTNVIAIIQSGTYCDAFDEHVYIALDKCHNENLRQYLANRKAAGIEFDLNQAIDFAKQIIVGVMYIHDNNVIHLDLKPSNILISQNLRLIKIADFGLSIIVKSPKSKVFHKRQFGTNGYRPVESFGNGEVSMRTDIFSLGAVLLHLLSNGNDVFGLDEHTFIYNVMNDVTDTSGLLVGNPVTTEHLIKCMVSKERCRRPTIWEVSDHPCWNGKEGKCEFEYFADDEVDDKVCSEEVSFVDNIAINLLEREKEFIRKMREMGFDRKPAIVVFDSISQHLHRFDRRDKSLTKMHKYPSSPPFVRGVFSLGEYIYLFHGDRSTYRLEYCDVTATWERMNDWAGNEEILGFRVVVSSDPVFMLMPPTGTGYSTPVYQYDPSLDEWKRLNDKPTGSYRPALLCNDEFLYCIGGRNENYKSTSRVERMDLKSAKWTRVSDMNQPYYDCSAAECKDNIYVVSTIWLTTTFIEKYDPKVDQWTEMISSNIITIDRIWKNFSIDGNLFGVDRKRIIKYDVEKNTLCIVASYPNMYFYDAILVNMSS